MKPHKHAELIKAWANGTEIQESYYLGNNGWSPWTRFRGIWADHPMTTYRIKPSEVAQWRKDFAQALKEGKEVQYLSCDGWVKSTRTLENWLNPEWDLYDYNKLNYRIKPEPKPDVVTYCSIPLATDLIYFGFLMSSRQMDCDNLKLIWDGETGKLKDAEVIA